MEELLYGVAYYDEYMPYERLEKDIEMMKAAGINTVRIAESTWSTCEPEDGVFDFSHVIKVLDAMEEAGINVIVGTPTYAVPAWLVKKHPGVLATTKDGQNIYGARQNMDITNPHYLKRAEGVIRELLKVCADRKCVIGYQIDNETKYYGTAGENVQRQFVEYLKDKFSNDLDALNYEFGLDYWSNRINSWEEFPDVRGTINGSLGAEFEKFQRSLVRNFLCWQADIIAEYKREDQFVTHNFDFGWKGHSYGIQPEVNHVKCGKAVTIAGVDIYHPSQDDLTGIEIAFGGDVARSIKQDNYYVLETQAQGYPCWTPYKGQLRLCAYSHLASGAECVEYWHWHSIHNSLETYWKGLLSHDFEKNDAYDEACIVGNEFKKYSKELIHLKKKNDVAIMVSNEALTALKWFPICATTAGPGETTYNDIVRYIYDALFKRNIECDIIWPESKNLSDYKVIFTPALYSVPEDTLIKLKEFVRCGGSLVATFKSAFANENVKVFSDAQPHILSEVFGVTYNQIAFPKNVGLLGTLGQGSADCFMELLKLNEGAALAKYDHYNWKDYVAISENKYEEGMGYYLGTLPDEKIFDTFIERVCNASGVEIPVERFPVIVKKGTNSNGNLVTYYLNYSKDEQKTLSFVEGRGLFDGRNIKRGDEIVLKPWNLDIVISE